MDNPILIVYLSHLELICEYLFHNSFLSEILDFSVLLSFVPLITYDNAETDKDRILKDNKGKTGIYQWTHRESGKVYIGSAIDLSVRLSKYYSSSQLKRWDNYISRALILHTYSAFSLSILEFIDITDLSKEDVRKLILEREQYYLDLIFSADEPNTYNILKIAGSLLGFNHSDDSIAKIREAKIGENNHMFGQTGENHPMFGKFHSAEAQVKMSAAKGGGTIYIYDSLGTFVNSYSSARKAAEFFNTNHHTILKYARNNKLFQGKWYLSLSEKIKF